MNTLHHAKNGILMGIVNNIFNYILPFISRTIIIYKLGNEYLGLSSLFSSILQMLNLSELGFGTAISYMLYRPIAEKNIKKVNALLNLYRSIYNCTGLLIILLSFIMLPFLDSLIAGSHPDNINIYILYFIYIANTALSYFLFAYKRVLLTANQRYDIEINISTIIIVLQSLIQIIILLAFTNYYLYVLVLPFMTILSNIFCSKVVSSKYPQYKCEGKIDKNEVLHLLKNTGGALCSKIGSIIYLSADNIIISAFLGLTILGKYSNYYYIITALISVFAVIHNTIRPILGNRLVTNSIKENWRIHNMVFFNYIWLVIICCSLCLSLFQPFEYLWGGADNLLDFSIVILLVLYFYSGRIHAVMGVYLEAAGILWQGKFIPLLAAITNLFLNVLLVNRIGLAGVLISSIFSSIFITLPGNIFIIFKYLFTERSYKISYLKNILWLSIVAFFCISINYHICQYFSSTAWSGLIIKLIVSLCISNLIFLLFNFKNQNLKESLNFIFSFYEIRKRRSKL